MYGPHCCISGLCHLLSLASGAGQPLHGAHLQQILPHYRLYSVEGIQRVLDVLRSFSSITIRKMPYMEAGGEKKVVDEWLTL